MTMPVKKAPVKLSSVKKPSAAKPSAQIPRLIFVAGMHRSGTSVVARLTNLLGVGISEDLLPANSANERGYWESRRLVDINDQLLSSLGSSWLDPRPLPVSALLSAAGGPVGVAATDFLREELAGDGQRLLKDPRLCRVLPFWLALAKRLGIAAGVLIPYRHPQEVAASLAARDKFPEQLGLLLWLANTLYLEFHTRGTRRALLSYESVLRDWKQAMRAARDVLGFGTKRPSPQTLEQIETYLSPKLRHFQSTPDAGGGELGQLAAQVYDLLAEVDAKADALDAARGEFARWIGVFDPVISGLMPQVLRGEHYAREADWLHKERGNLYQERGDLHKERGNLFMERQGLIVERDALHRERATMNSALELARKELDILRTSHADMRRELDISRQELGGARGERDTLRQELNILRAQQQQLRQELEAARGGLEQLYKDQDTARRELGEVQRQYRVVSAENEHRKTLHEFIHPVLTHCCRKGRRLVIWGAGNGGERTLQLLAQYGLVVQAFIDSNPAKAGQLFMGAPIETPRLTLEAPVEHRPFVVIGSMYATQISEQLAAAGFVLGQDFVANPFLMHDSHALSHLALPGGATGTPGLEKLLDTEFGHETTVLVKEQMQQFGLDQWTGGKEKPPAPRDSEIASWLQGIRALAPLCKTAGVPDVSIVLPVYNQLRYTLACIHSLFKSRPGISFEVLVADDCSTDATEATLRDANIPGVRHLRGETNLGFIRNCNAAARQARGRIVVFLNNDTLILPGWLDELVATLERDSSVGFVGSRLLYPDGRLQESGGIIWQDASGHNYGRREDPHRPEFGYLREVDYVSGAAVAVPRALWEELDGFDENFEVAYCEDVDLAFKVAATGRRVVVQPLSALIHFEGISHGTDINQGVKAYQVKNSQRLREKWRDKLAAHRANGVEIEREKERKVARRVLVIDHVTPEPDKDAGSVACMALMEALQTNGYKVSFIPETNFCYFGAATKALQRRGIEAVYAPYYRTVGEYLTEKGKYFDLVLMFRSGIADRCLPHVRKLAPQAKVIFHAADLHFLREQRQAEVEGNQGLRARAEQTRALELSLVDAADLTIVHSEYEAKLLQEQRPRAQVDVLSWICETVPPVNRFEQRQGVVFVGGFRHLPNGDAVCHFSETIWPRVRAAIPGIEFHVVGSDAPPEVYRLDGVDGIKVHGHVKNLDPLLERMKLMVVPLRYGAGLKGKIATSLSHGLPCVTTAIGAEGMGVVNDRELLIADAPEDFAAAVIRAYHDQDIWERLSQAGMAFVERHFSRAAGERKMAAILQHIGLPAGAVIDSVDQTKPSKSKRSR